jgi:hypothetical protein
MKNVAELLRTVEVVANHRYNGEVILSKDRGGWTVGFHRKDPVGVTLIEAGEGRTLIEALERACEREIGKAEDEFDSVKAFMKQVGKK